MTYKRIGKLIISELSFLYEGRKYSIPSYLDVVSVERDSLGNPINVTVNIVYQPIEYLFNRESAYSQVRFDWDKTPAEVRGVIEHEKLF